jgi:hypothetical protein
MCAGPIVIPTAHGRLANNQQHYNNKWCRSPSNKQRPGTNIPTTPIPSWSATRMVWQMEN